jgi:hypothetical protein
MRAPARKWRSSMRVAIERTIWSGNDSPEARDSKCRVGVLVISPSQ